MDTKFSNGYTDHDDIENDAASELSSLRPIPEETELKLHEVKQKELKFNFIEKIKFVKNSITVEPLLFAYVMPCMLASMAAQNLNLEKACSVNLNYSSEICDALTRQETENYTHIEEEVQRIIAGAQWWKNIIQTVIPFVIIQFVGAWSDKTGKRIICILIPIVGEFVTCIGFIVNTYFFYELPFEAAMLTEVLFPSITGGWYTNFMGVFSYIGDITTVEDRTFRIGIANLCYTLAMPVGNALSGILLRWIGYYGVFVTSASLYLCSLIYGFYCLDDPVKKETPHKSVKEAVKEFFDIKRPMETYRVAFKSGPSNRRLKICLLLLALALYNSAWLGEWSVLYLFTRYKFNWNEVQYSLWTSYCIVTSLLGTLFSMSLFTNYMKIDDAMVAVMANTSKFVASIAYVFARTDIDMYIVPLLEILIGSALIALRSIATKLVESDEMGKINSVIGMAESSMPLLYGPLYSRVYMATMHALPGAIFLLSAAVTFPAILIFGWLYYDQKKTSADSKANAILIDEKHDDKK